MEIIVLLVCVFLLYRFVKAVKEKGRRATVQRELHGILDKHLGTLTLKKQQLITTDAYGIVDSSKWMAEVSYFINKVVLPQSSQSITASEIEDFIKLIEESTDTTIARSGPNSYSESMGPVQFEHLCARVAMDAGWNARVTQLSGDQGVDVIADDGSARSCFSAKNIPAPSVTKRSRKSPRESSLKKRILPLWSQTHPLPRQQSNLPLLLE